MQFSFESLIAPGLAIFLVVLFVAFEVTRSVVFAALAALLKAGTFLLYFGIWFDGTFTFLDDWAYLDLAIQMYDQNLGLFDTVGNVDALQGISGGEHYGYSLYNVYAITFFGFGYYAPVAMNIILTAFIAWAGANLAATEFRFNDGWRKLFFAFLLFHPDIFAWSNIMNGKDTLLLLLHILLLHSVSMYFRGRVTFAVILALTVCTMLSALRFYVPLLFGAALALSMFISAKNYSNSLKFVAAGFVLAFFILTDYFKLENNINALRADFVNPFYGAVRFMLTPIPFNTELEYSFLNIPALIHWILMPFVILGFLAMAKNPSDYEQFFLIYIMIFLALYSCYGELQGPRHRVQIDYAWAVLQFMGIQPFLRKAFTVTDDDLLRRRMKVAG